MVVLIDFSGIRTYLFESLFDKISQSFCVNGKISFYVPTKTLRKILLLSYSRDAFRRPAMTSKTPATRRILIVDDDPDITLTFKEAFEAENENSNNNNKIPFVVSAYNDFLLALN